MLASQPETSPSSTLPVYVMLPLDTVWLLERDDRAVRGPSCESVATQSGIASGFQTDVPTSLDDDVVMSVYC